MRVRRRFCLAHAATMAASLAASALAAALAADHAADHAAALAVSQAATLAVSHAASHAAALKSSSPVLRKRTTNSGASHKWITSRAHCRANFCNGFETSTPPAMYVRSLAANLSPLCGTITPLPRTFQTIGP